ncbi:MAG: DUF308 domain-containing protein [Acidimicrobiia bacterium]|nr:DUF308 domain-containing protein [Acidimicrobiia bacterium]
MADEQDRRSAMDVFQASRVLAYTVGVIALGAGVVLLGWPDRTVVVVARLAGILIAIVGIAESIEAVSNHRRGSYWGLLLLRGVLNVGVGALLIFWPGITVTVLVWLFGLDLVVTAVLGLIAASSIPPEYGKNAMIFRSVVAIVFGILIVAWPDVTLWVVTIIVAVQLLVIGLVLLWSGYRLGRNEAEIA